MSEEAVINPLDQWFKGSEEEPEITNQQESTEDVEEVEETEEQEEVQEEETEESEIDYDAPPKKEESVEEVEETFANDTEAVKRAKIEGKERKRLEIVVKEKDLEIERLREESESTKTRLNELENVRIEPDKHPDYTSKRDKLQKEIRDSFDDFDAPHKGDILKDFGGYLSKYRTADSDSNRTSSLDALKDDLAAKMFGEENTFEMLEKDDRKEVSAMLRLIKTSVGKADELHELYDNLEKRSKTGTLAMGVREYEERQKEMASVFDTIGDLPEDVIEANPHAIESLVALSAKTPDGKKRLEAVKRDFQEIVWGPRPLTQAEIEKLEANGTDIKKFNAERQKAAQAKLIKLAPLIIQGLVARGSFKQMSEELAGFKKKKASAQSEEDALLKTTKKKAPVVKEVKTLSPVDIMFKEVDK